MALKETVKECNRMHPITCVALLVNIDFTSGKDTLEFYFCDGTKIFRFPTVNILTKDGEVLEISTGSGTHK